ncbi:hypothetical protein PQG02_08390 [Nostoc sp. UHCC 0926]|uniref:hypothetical protein n=1 Tax=unclassified Nostoc TaxID=2593658 RepID=UPI00235F3986|nr:hypothetical protein [Nostoc sp. UHCC 0926]WDD34334.1 hypothetical protein PQG02_08390 [Nostoc sp. UHCC 0926]
MRSSPLALASPNVRRGDAKGDSEAVASHRASGVSPSGATVIGEPLRSLSGFPRLYPYGDLASKSVSDRRSKWRHWALSINEEFSP